jgi:aryl-alcohol dehydrogenase-like predicted oxidoreductase
VQYRTLGRTGWRVSLLGLGTGGVSMLGQRYELPPEASAKLIRHALDRGLNMFDTAPTYGDSEERLGLALQVVPRDTYYVSTKFQPYDGESIYPASDLRKTLEQSLRRLRTEYIDLFYLHGVPPERYNATNDALLKELQKARDEGLIRAIGLTERYQTDHTHQMARQAIEDGDYDVLMVGLNLMSPDAVTSVLPLAQQHNVGIVVMCAVRTVLVDPVQRTRFLERWEQEGLLKPGTVNHEDPFGWLLDATASTIPEAAYKFAAHHPGASCVLTGTASIEHFNENLDAISGPPLADKKTQRILDTYGPVQRNVQPERIRMTRR